MSNCPITLKFGTIEECLCRVNMTYMVNLGAIKGKYDQNVGNCR